MGGAYAYLGMGPRLLVLNVSSPAHPQTVGETGILSGMVGAVRLLGQHILADVAGDLAIIDVADPAHPALVSTLPIPGSEPIADIEAAGDYAYVLTRSRFMIITVADPLHPTMAGVYEAADDLYDAHVTGTIAYLAAGGAGLQVIDMADPSDPTLVGAAAGPAGGATGVWVAGGYAYMVGPYGFTGNEVVLTVLDVSTAAHPFMVGEYVDIPSSERYLYRVQVVGHYAFAYGVYYDSRGEYSAVWIADVSHPGEPPSGAARFEMLHRVTDFRLVGERLYATVEGGGLEILDVGSPMSPSLLTTHYPGIGPLLDVGIAGSYATVISSRPQVVPFFGIKPDGDLSVVDVVDPRQPREVARIQTSSDTKSLSRPALSPITSTAGTNLPGSWMSCMRLIYLTQGIPCNVAVWTLSTCSPIWPFLGDMSIWRKTWASSSIPYRLVFPRQHS